jgi:hypothetical protein
MGGTGTTRRRLARSARDVGINVESVIKAATASEENDIPEAPEFDAAADARLRQALIERMRRTIIRGQGRKATIKTSPLGITTPTPIKTKKLTGV